MNHEAIEQLISDIGADQAADAELQRLHERSEALAAERLALADHSAVLLAMKPTWRSFHDVAVDSLVEGVDQPIKSPAALTAALNETSARDRQIVDAQTKVDLMIEARRKAIYQANHAERAASLQHAAAVEALRALVAYGNVVLYAQEAEAQITAAAGVGAPRACAPVPMTRQRLALALEAVEREGVQVPGDLAEEIRVAAHSQANALNTKAEAARSEARAARKQRIQLAAVEAAERLAEKRAEWLAGAGIERGATVGWSASR